jgi:hypothetical protein
MNKKDTKIIAVVGVGICAALLTALLVVYFIYIPAQTGSSLYDPESMRVASGEIITQGGAVAHYTFSPGDAGDPRLIGHYEVVGAQTMNVYVLFQEGCPSPLSAFECTSIYSTPNQNRGNVDVDLTPGRTYYLEFYNDSLLFPKTTNVDFYVHYD